MIKYRRRKERRKRNKSIVVFHEAKTKREKRRKRIKKRKEKSSVRNCALIKAVSSEIPFFEGVGARLLNKLYHVKSFFALPRIIHGFVSLWNLHSREDSRA